MKKILFLTLLLFSTCIVYASHIVGGEMIYQYVRTNTAAKTKTYRITLRLFRDQNCQTPCAEMPVNVYIGIFNRDNNNQFPSPGTYYDVPRSSGGSVGKDPDPPCITNPPILDYAAAFYTLEVDLPDNNNGYTASYQTCCRVAPLENVINTPGGSNSTGSTYACDIPGMAQLGPTGFNSSPQFRMAVSTLCQNRKFTLDFSAADNDNLRYRFVAAYNGGSFVNAGNGNPAPPPYGPVIYISPYNALQPLGPNAKIDSLTGVISGIAPVRGNYVVCVVIEEYRDGKLIGTHRKDFIVNVAGCDFAGAELEPSYITCDDFSYQFDNLNNSPLNKTYLWNFGDGTTSTLRNPNHTYKDTGVYIVKLAVNPGETCGDEMTSVIKVYPGFKPDFDFAGICMTKPTQFQDKTTTPYGVVNSWKWDFGVAGSSTDISSVQNPIFTYTQPATYNAQLIVTSSKGCADTIIKPVPIIDKPPITLAFKDTLICNGDSVPLQASGTGLFSWTPTNTLTNPNTANPVASPSVTTTYTVKLDESGCINTDTVRVRVVNAVTLRAMPDTVICATDSVQLSAVTDGLSYKWAPAGTINNPTLLRPMAKPVTTTTYQLTTTIGRCSATDDVTVTLVPYPIANAGLDTIICYQTSAQLNGSMVASSFTWAPLQTLTNANTLNPVAGPITTTTDYVLTVQDVLGCPKPVSDTVRVTVLPKIYAFAGRDTAVIIGQPLQLNATGGVSYIWQPPAFLNDPVIADPVAIFDGSVEAIQYKVLVHNEAGCVDSAFIKVKVFKTDPSIFVPTAFTPNGDGKNDTFRPIAVGMSKIEYFRVFNRWGQQVFSTTQNGKGWDGRINGKEQGSGTFAWVVKGVDYTGKVFFAKGTVTLIR